MPFLQNRNLTKLDILTLFGLQSMNSTIQRAFEKITKYVFIFILPTPNLTSFFRHFHNNIFLNISYPYSSLNLGHEYHF